MIESGPADQRYIIASVAGPRRLTNGAMLLGFNAEDVNTNKLLLANVERGKQAEHVYAILHLRSVCISLLGSCAKHFVAEVSGLAVCPYIKATGN